MGRKCVAQGVGGQGAPGRFAEVPGDAALNPAWAERLSGSRQEQVVAIRGLLRNQFPPSRQILGRGSR